jgi:hypothetical protein
MNKNPDKRNNLPANEVEDLADALAAGYLSSVAQRRETCAYWNADAPEEFCETVDEPFPSIIPESPPTGATG